MQTFITPAAVTSSMENSEKLEAAPDSMNDLYRFIQENTGVLGDATKGRATVHIGGNTIEVVSNRRDFDSQDTLLQHVESDPRYTIQRIGVMSLSGGEKHPSITVKAFDK